MKQLRDFIIEYKETFLSPPQGFKTGLTRLDGLISLQKGELCIIGGRSSMGKTSLLLDIALNISRTQRIGLFSLEMSAKEIIRRMVANLSGIPFNRIRRPSLTEGELTRVNTALTELSRRQIFLDERTGLTLRQVEAEIEQLHKSQPLDILFVDYLQLIKPAERYRSRVDEVTEISGGLKGIAKSFNVALVAACQLNRQADYREDTSFRPRLSDLRESGSIENDADLVVLLYRPYYYARHQNASAQDDGSAEIIVAKQRNGATGTINCNFNSQVMSFRCGEIESISQGMF